MSDKQISTVQLRSAVDDAVRLTAELIADVERDVETAFLLARAGTAGSPELNALHERLRRSLRRHLIDADTFRVVLFGRTGTGKSSLIEALSEGDGSTISTGVSDFTTGRRQVAWGPLELVDTPGTGGWGRTMSRQELEERAGDAVASADLVMLTFDNMNQQSGEFESVQAHIQRFGRPCVAILNMKNELWRDPTTHPRHARKLQGQVETNARFISGMMGKVGLSDVPIIAIHSQNAVGALADDDYRGPDAPVIHARRASRGRVALEDASNIRALVDVLTLVLENGAAKLRTQSVRRDIGGQVGEALRDVDELIVELQQAHTVAVASLAQTLNFIGSGSVNKKAHRAGTWQRSDLGKTDWIASCAQDLADSGVRIDRSGALQTVMEQLLVIHVDKAVRALRSHGDQAVHEALATGAKLDGEKLVEELRPTVSLLDVSVKTCVDRLAENFSEHLEGMELDIQLQLDLERLRETSFTTKADRTGAHAWAAAEVLSAVAGAVAIIASGPIGWTVAAGALLASWFSGRKRKKAHAKAECIDVKAHARVVDAIRSEINKIAEAARASVYTCTEKMASGLASSVLPDLCERTVETRERSERLQAELGCIRSLTEIGVDLAGAEVIRNCAQEVRNRTGHRTGHDSLLGAQTTVRVNPELAAAREPDVQLKPLLADLRSRAEHAKAHLTAAVPPAVKSNESLTVRGPVVGIVGRPRVGSTSLANALRQEPGHGWRTRVITQDGSNASGCDLLVWLFAPNPTVDGHAAFTNLLGPNSLTRSEVVARSVFVIGQADTWAQDPLTDPQAYLGLIDRKTRELCDMLASQGVEVAAPSILCTMASPFSFLLRDFPQLHPVSGVPDLASVLTVDVAGAASAHRVRHRMMDRATRKLERANLQADQAAIRLADLDISIGLASAAANDSRRLIDEFDSSAINAVGDYVDGLALTVVNATSAAEIRPRLARLTSWPEHDRVAELMHEWEREFSTAQQRIYDRLAEDFEERGAGQSLGASGLGIDGDSDRGEYGKYVAAGAKIIQRAARNRDAWYSAVKFVSRGKYKFKPWGAIKGAKVASKLGVALAALGVVITVAELAFDARARSNRTKIREEVLQKSRMDVADVLGTYLWADSDEAEDGRGPLRVATDLVEALERDTDPLRRQRDTAFRQFERAISSREKAEAELSHLNNGGPL